MEKWLLHSPGETTPLELTSDVGWAVQVKDGLLKAPALVGEDGQRQGHGMQWRQKTFGPSSAVLSMVVWDTDGPVIDPRAWEALHEKIVRHSSWPYGLSRLQRFPDAASSGGRWAYVERSQPIAPATMGDYAASYDVEFNLPDGCWYDNQTSTWTGAATNGTKALTAFAGATFPSTNLTVSIAGPTPAGLTLSTVAGWLRLTTAVASGTTVSLNCQTGTITPGWSKSVRFSGGTFLEIPPQSAAPTLTVSGGGSGGTITITGPRSYQSS